MQKIRGLKPAQPMCTCANMGARPHRIGRILWTLALRSTQFLVKSGEHSGDACRLLGFDMPKLAFIQP